MNIGNTGSQQLEYKHEIYNSFDETDTRREATFIASYSKNTETNELTLRGTHVRKNIGYVNAQGNRIYCGDYIFYRLPLVYLMLAEIENMQGGDVAQYINIIRKRAYNTNWDETTYGYKIQTSPQMNWLFFMKKIKNLFRKDNVGGISAG